MHIDLFDFCKAVMEGIAFLGNQKAPSVSNSKALMAALTGCPEGRMVLLQIHTSTEGRVQQYHGTSRSGLLSILYTGEIGRTMCTTGINKILEVNRGMQEIPEGFYATSRLQTAVQYPMEQCISGPWCGVPLAQDLAKLFRMVVSVACIEANRIWRKHLMHRRSRVDGYSASSWSTKLFSFHGQVALGALKTDGKRSWG